MREWRDRDMVRARNHVRHIPIHNAVTLASKGKALSEFLKKYGQDIDSSEQPRMARAAELARQFSTPHSYRIRLKSFGGLTEARSQTVRLFVGGEELRPFHSQGKTKISTGTEDPFPIQWKAGQPIRIQLDVGYGTLWTSMQEAASCRDDSIVALQRMQGRQGFSQLKPGWENICRHSFVQFEVDGISPEDWNAFADYILPGNK